MLLSLGPTTLIVTLPVNDTGRRLLEKKAQQEDWGTVWGAGFSQGD